MAAITWQNVFGESLSNAALPMKYAQESFNNAFSGLDKVIKQREATDTANWEQGSKNNTADFRSAVRAPQNAEEFKALLASGALEKQRQSYGAQIDQTAAANELDGRLATLQGRDTAANTFNESMATSKAAPIIEQYKLLKQSGDNLGAAALMAANPGIRGGADALQFGHGIDQRGILEGRATEANKRLLDGDIRQVATDAQTALLRPFEVKQAQSRLDTDAASRSASNASAALSRSSAERNDAKTLQEEAAAELEAKTARNVALLKGTKYADGPYTGADAEGLMKTMTTTGTGGKPEQQAKIVAMLNRITAEGGIRVDPNDPKSPRVPLSKSDVKAAILGSQNTLISWNEGYADNVEERLTKGAQQSTRGLDAAGKPFTRNANADDYALFMDVMRKATAKPAEDPPAVSPVTAAIAAAADRAKKKPK
jgi:hypothetical protein